MPRADPRALDAHAGFPSRGGGRTAIAARAAFAKLVWLRSGERRLPGLAALDRALAGLAPRELEWLCELAPLGPLYLLPTRAWVSALAREVRALGAKRVLEVAAGDGFLSRALAAAAPDLDVVASDSHAWADPRARMSPAERRAHHGAHVPGIRAGANVLRLEARAAIRRVKPDVVLAAWLPPGPLLDRIIAAPARFVLEIGAAGGVTSGAWSWRWAHDFPGGPVESLARCRLDARPARDLHSRVTLYFGALHPEHAKERVRPGDWLWQFRPR